MSLRSSGMGKQAVTFPAISSVENVLVKKNVSRHTKKLNVLPKAVAMYPNSKGD